MNETGIGEQVMSKKLFTEKEIKILSKNQYVKTISSKGITYTEEFKQILINVNKGNFREKSLWTVDLT